MKKIILVCSAGMSTAILVNKMIKSAEEQGIECVIEAHGREGLEPQKGKWDVCLVGPQIRFAKDEIAGTLGIPTDVIPMQIYGMADGPKALEFALNM